jgi:Calx-beta domain/Beta-propeller repeat
MPARSPQPLAMSFEPNLGQSDPAVKFLARGRGYGLFLTATESVLVLAPPARLRAARGAAPRVEPVVVRMRLLGADPGAALTGLEPLPGRSHYLLGPAERWRQAVPTFARVQYSGVYPGVSLVFYGTGRELEYDLVVAPGADPGRIALAFEGAEHLRVDDAGDLVLAVAGGELRLRRPVVYQETDGGRRTLDGGYVLDGQQVRFRVVAWDASRPLVIDPVLGYSTFLGGSSNDEGLGIAVDSQGNAYVTGSTISSNFPVSPVSLQPQRAGVTDAFVAKLSPAGVLLYSTFLGGSGDDAGNAIAVDTAGNAYVGGTTNSVNFPVFPVNVPVGSAFQTVLQGGTDGFVAKLDPGGSTVAYSTYLGSNTDDSINGLGVDAAGNAYVTGATASPNFPNNRAIQCLGAKSTGSDAFVARLQPTGAAVGYCRFVGGSGIDAGQALAADPDGTVVVVGTTTSSDLPVQAALQGIRGGRTDGFVGRLTPGGLLVYLTYLGGSGDDSALAVATDATGNVHVTGFTDSIDFPTLAPWQPSLAGGSDAFIAVLNVAGSGLGFATYLGGVGDDVGTGIGIHPDDGSIYVAGATESIDFPLGSPIQARLTGRSDAFVVRLTATGDALVSATFLGGTGDDAAQALAVDADGVVYVTGSTTSPTFPTTSPIRGPAGLLDAFVAQIAEAGVIQFTVADYQVSENGGSVIIAVRRSGDTTGTATVQFATSDDTATAGSDYTAAAGTLTFAPGQGVATFTVTVLPDTLCDGDETVNLGLTNPGGGSVLGTRDTAVLTILDPAACVNFTASTYQAGENAGTAQVVVNRSGPGGGQVTVRFSTSDGTATAPADYTPVLDRTVTFAPGVRNVTVAIPIVNDAVLEGVETLNVVLSSVQGPATLGVRSAATLDVLDEDIGGVIQLSTTAYTVGEGGGSATITVTRSGSTAGGATVDYATSDGTATAGADYTATGGTLTFARGQTRQTFTVPITPDALAEGVETVNITLSNPGPPSTMTTLRPDRDEAVLRIVDAQLTLALKAAVSSVRENAGGATIAVELTGVNTTPVTVTWTATPGTALAGSDFGTRGSAVPPTGLLTFSPGGSPTTVRTRTFRVPILQDPLIEGTESLSLTLSGAVGAPLVAGRDTATLSIVDDDSGGAIQFSAATYTVAENVGLATIAVTRSGSSAGGATVDYTASDGSAVAGVDYTATAGTLTFGVGETRKTFTVPITDDILPDGVETVVLTLSTPGPNPTTTLGTRTTATLRIVDDEPALAFTLPNFSVRENAGSARIVVELTGVTVAPVTVSWAATDSTATAGSDYGARGSTVPPGGTLTFSAGGSPTTVRTRAFTVPVLTDTIVEATETVNLALSAPAGGQLVVGRDTAVLSIVDDDRGGVIQFSAASFNASECGAAPCNARVTLSRSGGAASGATVDFTTADGTAVAGTDYVATTGTATFGVGQTSLAILVPLQIEPGAEAVKSFSVTISNPGGGASLGGRTTTEVRITDSR